jgi:four helix bundle protein
MEKQTYNLDEKLLDFSARIIKIVAQLPNTKVGNHVALHLLKSGTLPYPNHGQVQFAESTAEFIHKFHISLKELRETQRWLKLIQRVPLLKNPEMLNRILDDTEELIRIFSTGIKAVRRNSRKRNYSTSADSGLEVERRTSNSESERRTSNIEHRTFNVERSMLEV